jgi:hypothetical protein
MAWHFWKSSHLDAESEISHGRDEPLAIKKDGLPKVSFARVEAVQVGQHWEAGSIKEKPGCECHPFGRQGSSDLTQIIRGLALR